MECGEFIETFSTWPAARIHSCVRCPTRRCSRLRPPTDYYYFTFLAWSEAAELGTLDGQDFDFTLRGCRIGE
jgi:hypothetical protein